MRRLVYLSSIKAGGDETEYGRAKLAAERALAEVAARTGMETVVLRPPLVYGPGVKANFFALMRAIDAGWPLPFGSVSVSPVNDKLTTGEQQWPRSHRSRFT